MAKVLQLINGRPRQSTFTNLYDQTTVPGTVTSGTAITLPSSGTYQSGTDLEVFVNDIAQEPVTDWNIVGASAPRTQITFTYDLVATDRVRFRTTVLN